MRSFGAWSLLAVLGMACERPEPDAGQISRENADALLLRGATADGSIGDYYLRNEHLVAIIQKPGREFCLSPYGGNIIDFGDAARRIDVLGESLPLLQFGLTANFLSVRIVDDGSAGGPAILEAEGEDELWDFVNLESLSPLLRYQTNERGDPIGILKFDPVADQPLTIRARYILPPDARELQVRYFVRNLSGEEIGLRVGFGLDVRGEAEPFSPGRGYTDPGASLSDIAEMLNARVDSPFVAYQAESFAIGLRSADFLDEATTPRLAVAIMGVAVVLLGHETLLDLFDHRAPFVIPPRQERGFGFDLYLGDDVGDIYTWAVAEQDWPTLSGRVVDEQSGEPVASARVAVLDPLTGNVENAFLAAADGSFGGRMRPGRYRIVADDLTRPPDPGRIVELPAGAPADVTIELGSPAFVRVEVQSANDVHDPGAAYTPCRVLLLGTAPSRTGGVCGAMATCTNEPFRHDGRWELEAPTPYAEHLVFCHTSMEPDAPLAVVPGRYLAVVSRGPEYDTLEELLDVGPGQTHLVAGTLHRAVDSKQLVAADFHLHMVRSPDSVVPLEERAKSLATAGLDFAATSDHDAVTDLGPVVEWLGLADSVITVPGVEVSTHDLGHFNGFPILPLAGIQLGGPPDWAGGRRRPTPGQLFERMRLRGARIVQVNHPRRPTSYFNALGLRYDLAAGTIDEDPEIVAANEVLHMPSGVSKWSPAFDTLEIYNGTTMEDADHVMRDWFNFLSMGFVPAGTGVSDSHDIYRPHAGEPRTYIMATVDQAPHIDLDELFANLKAGRAFASSGPVLRVTAVADGAGATFGDLLSPAPGDIEVRIEAETPAWYALTTAELFVTQSYVATGGEVSRCPTGLACHPEINRCVLPVEVGCDLPLAVCPSQVSTGDACPSEGSFIPCTDDASACEEGCRTCQANLVWTACSAPEGSMQACDALSPSVTVPLEPADVAWPNGGAGRRYEAIVTLASSTLGATDGWLVVRVRGAGHSQYPVSLTTGAATIHPDGDRPETFVTYHHQKEPFALGNPIFLDRNGNGRYDPPYPLR